MNKFRVTAVIVVLLLVTTANAQFYAGGSIGLSTNSTVSKYDGTKTDGPSSFSFDFSPEAGMALSEDLTVGVKLTMGISKNNDRKDPETVNKSTHFGIIPIVDYTLIKFNKFSVLAEGQVPFVFGGSSISVGNKETDGPSEFATGFSIAPLLTYKVGGNLTLLTKLNFMSMNLGIERTSEDYMGKDLVNTETSFHIGANANNIVNIGAITVGARYFF